jgi:hypothetical protein
MPKKRRGRTRLDEHWRRNALISSFAPSVRLGVKGENTPEPEIQGRPWLELRGQLTEPIRDVRDVVFRLWPDPDKRVGPVRPVAVAHIVNVRPRVEVIGSCGPAEFDYIWSLALSGHLTHAFMYFTKPHYGSASVLSMAFSNEREE